MAAVVLIPIAIMIVACVLERFEARAFSVAPLDRRSRADLRTVPPAVAAAPEARRLALVPAPPADQVDETDQTDAVIDWSNDPTDRPGGALGLDPDTVALRRAS